MMERRRFYVIGFALLAAVDTLIQIAFKLAAVRIGPFQLSPTWFASALTDAWVYVAIAGYLITFVAWMVLLERAPIGPAFVASHLQVVTVLVASVVLFHEHLQNRQIAGALCIVAGIVCLAFSAAPQAAGDSHPLAPSASMTTPRLPRSAGDQVP